VISFSIGQPHFESQNLSKRDSVEVLLGVVAEIRVVVGGSDVLRSEGFPIVELAAHLNGWLASTASGPFRFESMDAEGDLLWLRERDGRWHMGSDWHPENSQGTELAEFKSFAQRYVDDVRNQVNAVLGIDVSKAFREIRAT
jgi:hypothetical protein